MAACHFQESMKEQLKCHPNDPSWAGGLAGSSSRSAYAKTGWKQTWELWLNASHFHPTPLDNLVALVCFGCSK